MIIMHDKRCSPAIYKDRFNSRNNSFPCGIFGANSTHTGNAEGKYKFVLIIHQ